MMTIDFFRKDGGECTYGHPEAEGALVAQLPNTTAPSPRGA